MINPVIIKCSLRLQYRRCPVLTPRVLNRPV